MLPRSKPHKRQIIVGVLLLEKPARGGHDLVHHVGVRLGGLGIEAGLDGRAISVQDEAAPHSLGLTEILKLFFDLSGHGGGVGRRRCAATPRGRLKMDRKKRREQEI